MKRMPRGTLSLCVPGVMVKVLPAARRRWDKSGFYLRSGDIGRSCRLIRMRAAGRPLCLALGIDDAADKVAIDESRRDVGIRQSERHELVADPLDLVVQPAPSCLRSLDSDG